MASTVDDYEKHAIRYGPELVFETAADEHLTIEELAALSGRLFALNTHDKWKSHKWRFDLTSKVRKAYVLRLLKSGFTTPQIERAAGCSDQYVSQVRKAHPDLGL